MCGLYGALPTSYDISSTLNDLRELPTASGEFTDFDQLASRDDPSQLFAVKSFRVSLDNRELVGRVSIVRAARSFPPFRSLLMVPSSRNTAR